MRDERPKITECWTWEEESQAPNMYMCSFEPNPDEYQVRNKFNRPAVLMWREDYDAMLRELEELRKANQAWADICERSGLRTVTDQVTGQTYLMRASRSVVLSD